MDLAMTPSKVLAQAARAKDVDGMVTPRLISPHDHA